MSVGASVDTGMRVGVGMTTGVGVQSGVPAAAAPPSPPGKNKIAITTTMATLTGMPTKNFHLPDPPPLADAKYCPAGAAGGPAPAAAGRGGGFARGGGVPAGGADLIPGKAAAAVVVATGGLGVAAGAGAGATGCSVNRMLSTAAIHSWDSGLPFCSSPNAVLNTSRKTGSSSSQEEMRGPKTVSKSAVAPRPIRARMFLLCCSRMAGSGMFCKSRTALAWITSRFT